MTLEQKFWRFWLGGLALFGGLIVLSFIRGDASQYTILDHQAAGTAAMVDTIQADWRANGLRNLAIFSMIGDFIFIGVYGIGSYFGGRYLAEVPNAAVRLIGWAVALAAVIFVVTDYAETVLQFIQLVQEHGVDWMAGTAATVQPIKVAAWMITFLGIVIGLILKRIVRSTA